ncbi:OmpP1/FadL family transporter [Flavobacterium tegetincola]|uniref:OmpP1/FadL family transporter n=1 Tax=Flavobacterium tegetincola TaxID=150172 RepID=UPI00041C614D|nr:outer membrane protein transport protein [Flavobacterium tegetincola]
MKKLLSFIIIVSAFTTVKAQQVSDALQYANDDINGTARFRAMGGAFGALGGDLSSLSVNPAGSAVFTGNFAAVTLSNQNKKNTSTYFGTANDTKDSSFDMNQFGSVWVFNNTNPDSKWTKMSLALNYDKTNNFNNSIYTQGYNPTNSVSNYFSSYANGIPESTLTGNSYEALNYNEQQAFLGYNGYLINPEAGNQYSSAVNPNGNYYQQNRVESNGYNGKIAFNLGAEYDQRFYFGVNLNAHFVDFENYTSFYEDYQDSPGNNTTAGVQASRFTNQLYTYGSGFSMQIGAIAKVTNEFRVGLAYESPTWYSLNDELKQTLSVNCADCGTNDTNFFADPNLVIYYPTYRLQTPSKYTGSLAYIFGGSGLLSVDYSLRDYSNTKFRPSNEFTTVNNALNNTLDVSNDLRIGAEYRIKQWSLRGGYRFEESPYKNSSTIGNLNSYSTGLGYNFGNIKLDMAYTYSKRDNNQAFFTQGLTDTSSIQAIQNNITLTLGFEL